MPNTRATLSREKLDGASLERLQKEARQLGLEISDNRTAQIETILNHWERQASVDIPEDGQSAAGSAEHGRRGSGARPGREGEERPLTAETLQQVMATVTTGILEQQREMQTQQLQFFAEQQRVMAGMMERLLSHGPGHGAESDRSARNPVNSGGPAGTESGSQRAKSRESDGYRGYNSTSNSVTWVATQIPEFGGTEEDSVTSWVQRVDKVAGIHGASDGVTLLAASSRLTKFARQWYDTQTGEVMESWIGLKSGLKRMFERKVPFYKAMQRVESRKWVWSKETFDQYAIAKLALIRRLDVPRKDEIHLLIGGIQQNSLRATALSIPAETVEAFLERMRPIAEGATEGERKSSVHGGSEKSKEAAANACKNCGKKGHGHRECRSDPTCFYCKAKGHRLFECPAKGRAATRSAQATPRAAVTAASVSAVDDSLRADTSSETVAVVNEVGSTELELTSPLIPVVRLAGAKCELKALLDTGSPVSFAKIEAYKRYVELSGGALRSTDRKLKDLGDNRIKILGVVETSVVMSPVTGEKFKIRLYILDKDPFDGDIIIGREFLVENKITVVYKLFCNADNKNGSSIGLFSELPLYVEESSEEEFRQMLCENTSDLNWSVRERLVDLLVEIEKQIEDVVDDGYCVRVRLRDKSVYAYAPRRFAHTERIQIRDITDDLMRRGIIQPSVSPYCARVIPVRKKDGRLRLCVDLRPLNNRVEKQKFPFPNIEDCLSRLRDTSVFTLLDLKDSFHQIKVHESDTKYFSFATPDGQFEYTCLPFGFSESPAEFQKRLLQVLRPFVSNDQILVYVDDLLIPTVTVDQNLALIQDVCTTLKRYGFKLNYDKCQFLKTRVEFLGYVVEKDRITLSSTHTQAIENFRPPPNIHELRRFLGLASYFRKFVKDFSIKAKPLQNLLRKDHEFILDEACVESFELLKKELMSYPTLALYNPSAETELHTDASSDGFGAILLQKQQSATWCPVAYFSKATNQSEKKYHSYELEMLAIVRAVERFHVYLYGTQFVIISDCSAIVYAVNKANLNPRIARWILSLQNYNFKIIHRPGKRMMHVDALSRCVGYVDEPPVERQLEMHQFTDPRIKEISKELEFRDSEKFALVDGLVYRKDKENMKFFVPEAMVNKLMRVYHDDMAHCGSEKTVNGINRTYWFPSLRKRVMAYIENCITCNYSNAAMNRFEGETALYPPPKAPMDTVHVDHFGPLAGTKDGYKHVLVVVDAYTRFTWLKACRSTTAKEVVERLTDIIVTFGKPGELVSDRGTAFTAKEFADFADKFQFRHRKVAVAAPWANGIVERVNRFLKNALLKMASTADEWKDNLGTVQYVINNTYHSSTKSSPSQLLLGYDQRCHTDFSLSQLIRELVQENPEALDARAEARLKAETATDLVRKYNKNYRDAKARKPSVYKEGELVLIRDGRTKPGENAKLKAKYKGPYRISKCLGNNRYVVTDIAGFNQSARPLNTILSSDRIKRWIRVNPLEYAD